MECQYCGEYRFNNAAQADCHARMTHAQYRCSCDRKFLTQASLSQHKEAMEIQRKEHKCEVCCRSFHTEKALQEHCRAKKHNPNFEPFGCPCGKIFKSQEALDQHMRSKQERLGIVHETYKSKGDYFDKKYKKKVMVDEKDRKESVNEMKKLDEIFTHIRGKKGGEKYGSDRRKAGSHATKTKVHKADEFDFNIALNVPTGDVKTKGTFPYIYEDKMKPREPNVSCNS